MIQLPGSPLQLGVCPVLAWEFARDRYRPGAPIGGGDQDALLRAAGILLPDGGIDSSWEPALAVASSARAGMVLVASVGDVVFLSNAYLSRDLTVVARSRAVAENGVIARMETVVEVGAAPAVDTWEALARVLPPQFQTPPKPGAPTPVDPAGRARLADLDGWDGAPDDLRRSAQAALSPEATLTIAWNGKERGTLLWFARGGELFRVDRSSWHHIPEGSCGDELVRIAERTLFGR